MTGRLFDMHGIQCNVANRYSPALDIPWQQILGTHLREVLTEFRFDGSAMQPGENVVCDCRTVEDANNVPGTKPVNEERLLSETEETKF